MWLLPSFVPDPKPAEADEVLLADTSRFGSLNFSLARLQGKIKSGYSMCCYVDSVRLKRLKLHVSVGCDFSDKSDDLQSGTSCGLPD